VDVVTQHNLLILVAVAVAHFALLRSPGRRAVPFPARAGFVEVSRTPVAANAVPSKAQGGSTVIAPVVETSAAVPTFGHARVEVTTLKLAEWGNTPPEYPESARDEEREGTVVLDLESREDGSVGALVVAKSAGDERLDTAALTAAKQWRFPREVKPYRVRVQFALQ